MLVSLCVAASSKAAPALGEAGFASGWLGLGEQE